MIIRKCFSLSVTCFRNNLFLPSHFIYILLHCIFLSCELFRAFTTAQPSSSTSISNGLNRLYFQQFHPQHSLYSDLLCPDPMLSWDTRSISRNSKAYLNNTSLLLDIVTMQSGQDVAHLPCHIDVRPPKVDAREQFREHGRNGMNTKGHRVYNLLLINITYAPLKFYEATPCKDFIQFKYDLNGTDMSCEYKQSRMTNTLNWPQDFMRRRKAFSIYHNLDKFLRKEEMMRTQFFFQLYFIVETEYERSCRVQQYELNLKNPKCSAWVPINPKEICGEYDCRELIFPQYSYLPPVPVIKKNGKGKDMEHFGTGGRSQKNSTFPFPKSQRIDVKLALFLTLLPIILFGMLVFGMQLFIFTTCQRRSDVVGTDRRDTQILHNSLNLWETLPTTRETQSRTVSFNPSTTTKIDMDPPEMTETPKILKSALKRKDRGGYDDIPIPYHE